MYVRSIRKTTESAFYYQMNRKLGERQSVLERKVWKACVHTGESKVLFINVPRLVMGTQIAMVSIAPPSFPA